VYFVVERVTISLVKLAIRWVGTTIGKFYVKVVLCVHTKIMYNKKGSKVSIPLEFVPMGALCRQSFPIFRKQKHIIEILS